MLVLRDFEEKNTWDKVIQEQGYFKINIPESCVFKSENGRAMRNFQKYYRLVPVSISIRKSYSFENTIK